jgi:hypothetical protein
MPTFLTSPAWPAQRSTIAIPSNASSICSPQPDQVGFLHILQVTFMHIKISYLALVRLVIIKIKLPTSPEIIAASSNPDFT